MADDTSKTHDLDDLLAVMARLRDPDTGCPWDVKQSFETIAPYTIEEAYEVADAIAQDDMDGLKDELGDLLLQVVYHAQMASEDERFVFADVVDAITRKMIRRHPHVFEDASRREEFITTDLWDRIKRQETAARGDDADAKSVLADVPVGLPGLTRAVKLQKRAAKVGFDWPDLAPVLAKVDEELAELKEVLAADDDGTASKARAAEEFGDLLFVMANVARHLGVDPEAALRGANAKFVRRFESIEAALASQGRGPEDATLEEMDALWDAAKTDEKKG
ncbi:MAG TPA: nucleoside triphosphate pyrophosphohydrolase [Methyloceanibacter sp.]|nr:nucleoside triphosphate pyrophosphohydrolase [Methyloceanibacter sp.]